jgi:hypothetical protein
MVNTENGESLPTTAGAALGELVAYKVGGTALPLRRAPLTREWMDRSNQRYAYRCLPLVLGSQLGWELLCPTDFVARWNGGPAQDDVQIRFAGDADAAVQAHFGHGVLTFSLGYLFRTPPGIGLLCLGPANEPKPLIGPLEGFIETDWSCYTFTMNWKFARPGEAEFRRGEPVCRIVPFPRAWLERFDPVVRDFAQMPAAERAEYDAWQKARRQFIGDLKAGDAAAVEQGWMRDYMRGQHFGADPRPEPDHQTKLWHRDFRDESR